ncbi:MAG: hypothetical protein RMJ37_06830 [Spirochaetia bacterium]|nr:hypothetical protein [Spirochaetota bacterium]MCX8095975.1 hypothetical protein [Spirochaetota bacterium]MDW8113030.1 hypothetical protein [Spirochaetia bacterium]
MKRFLVLLIFFIIPTLLFSQNTQRNVLDRVIAVVGRSEVITSLEFEKRKQFFISRISSLGDTNTISDREIMEKLITEKMVYVIGKEKNIIIPDDDKLVANIVDEDIKKAVQKEKTYYKDYVAEIKQQYIVSRLITSDDKLKKFLSEEPKDDEINAIIENAYERNKENLKAIKASFIIITINLPKNISLKEEIEIENVFAEISNLVETKRYTQAIQTAERKLGKYLVKDATMFADKPVSLQALAKERFPLELLGAIANIKIGQPLPYPIKGLRIKGEDYAFALRILSREETSLSKEEFKEMVLLDPNFKQQINAKVQDDRLKKWIIDTFKGYGFSVEFIDKSYEIKI